MDEPAQPGPEAATRRDHFWWLLFLLPPLLLFTNLDDSLLWQDEAETALLGRAVVLHGIPLAHDGRQPITDQPGRDVNEDGLWIWSPWLQHYVVAGSFLLAGESTFAARAPFAIGGWAFLLLFYAFAKSFTREKSLARTASLLLVFSVPFLLHARQARYYPLLSLFAVIHLWGYLRILRGQRSGGLLLAIGGIGLYQTFLPQLVASTSAFGLHALWHGDPRIWRPLLGSSAAVAVLMLPIFLYTESWSRDYFDLGYGFDSPLRFAATLRGYGLNVHLYAWPFLLGIPWCWRWLANTPRAAVLRTATLGCAAAGVAALASPPHSISFSLVIALAAGTGGATLFAISRNADASRGTRDPDWPPVVAWLVVTTLLLVVGLSPAPYFRYLLGVLPVLALTTAANVRALAPERRWLAPTVVAVLLLSDGLARTPFWSASELLHAAGAPRGREAAYAWNIGDQNANTVSARMLGQRPTRPAVASPALAFAGELSTHYSGPLERILPLLTADAAANESATIATTYEHFPLMFYTPLRVLRADWMESPQSLPRAELPEWFWVHGALRDRVTGEMRDVLHAQYDRIPVEGVEFNWENVPEPSWHRFSTPDSGLPIELYRRRALSAAPHDAGKLNPREGEKP